MALGRLGIGGATDAGGLFTIFGSVRLQGVDDAVNGFGKLTNSANKAFTNMASTSSKWGATLEKAFGGAGTKAGTFGKVLGNVGGVAASAGSAFLKLGVNLVLLEAKLMAAAVGGAATLIAKFEQLSVAAANAGSAVVEAANVVDLAFGDGATASWANDWAASLLTSQGISRGKALQGLGTIGEIFLGSGVTDVVGVDQAQTMSKSVIEMAGDFASVFNKTTDETLTLIQSGLRGNTQAIEQLGISMLKTNLNDYVNNTLQARYAGTGLFESNTETGWKWASGTGTEQNIAAYEYIKEAWEKMNVAGDFERTRDSLSNLNRTLSETKTSLLETFGMSFMQGRQNLLIPLRDVSTALVEDLIKAEGNWDEQMDVLNSYMPQIVNWAGTDVPNYIMDITSKMRDVIEVLNNAGVGEAVSKILEAVGSSIGMVLGPMGTFLKESLVQPAYDYLMENKDDIIEKAATVFNTTLEKLNESGILKDIGEAIGTAMGETAPSFAWAFVKGVAGGLWDAIVSKGTELGQNRLTYDGYNTGSTIYKESGEAFGEGEFSNWDNLWGQFDRPEYSVNPVTGKPMTKEGGQYYAYATENTFAIMAALQGIPAGGTADMKDLDFNTLDILRGIDTQDIKYAWRQKFGEDITNEMAQEYYNQIVAALAAVDKEGAQADAFLETGKQWAKTVLEGMDENLSSEDGMASIIGKLRATGVEGSIEMAAAVNEVLDLHPEIDEAEFLRACEETGLLTHGQVQDLLNNRYEIDPTGMDAEELYKASREAGRTAHDLIQAEIDRAITVKNHEDIWNRWSALGGVYRKMATGGVLHSATSIGRMSNGANVIAGESGAEAVAPISELQGYIVAAVRAAGGAGGAETNALLQAILNAIPSVLRFESGAVAAELAPAMNQALNSMKQRRMI